MKSTTGKFAPVPDEYVGVAAWGRYVHSLDYYIEQDQRRAVRVKAPLDAIYYDTMEMRWVTVRELADDHPFRQVYAAALEARQAAIRG